MPLIIPTGFAEVAFSFAFNGDSELMVCTFGIAVDDVVDAEMLSTLALAFHTPFDDELSSDLTLVHVKATVGADGPNPIVETPVSLAFGGSGSSVLPNAAMLLQKHTGLAGRRGKGRMFVPGLRAAAVASNGLIGTGALAGLNTAAASFLTNVQATSNVTDMALLHDNRPGSDPDPSIVSSLSVDRRLATQRRRLRP